MSPRNYDPDQPRVPAGKSTGGQWTKDGSGADASARKAAELEQERRQKIADNLGKELLTALKENDGFTHSLLSEVPEKGYMCSISTEQNAIPMDKITAGDISEFILKKWDDLMTKNYYVGGWVSVDKEDGILKGFLDVSENITKSLHETMIIARRRKQYGIWDIIANDEILVDDYWKNYKRR